VLFPFFRSRSSFGGAGQTKYGEVYQLLPGSWIAGANATAMKKNFYGPQ